MSDHTSIRMVRRADSDEYRRASTSEIRKRMAQGSIELEGVDGDESTNTVTYWYGPRVEQ